MRARKDYAGRKFGRLFFLERVGFTNARFLCDCGNETVNVIKSVVSGHTASCGCIRRERLVGRNQTHGLSQLHRGTYRSWKEMRGRCLNPRSDDYRNYGGRGITVCPRWDDFSAFFDDMGERQAGLTIDRVNINGNYEPGNCRWATPKMQANNKRTNHVLAIDGQAATLQYWADKQGIEPSKVRYRLNVGYSAKEAIQLEDLRGRT